MGRNVNGDDILIALADLIEKFRKANKILTPVPRRIREINRAVQIAREIFPYNRVFIVEDPLGMGAVILRIEGMDIVVDSQEKQKLFAEMNSLADNFEIYPKNRDTVRYAAVFNKVYAVTSL